MSTENNQGLGQCYKPQTASALADNTYLDYSWYHQIDYNN